MLRVPSAFRSWSTAYDAGRISEKTYFAFTEEYGENNQYVTGI